MFVSSFLQSLTDGGRVNPTQVTLREIQNGVHSPWNIKETGENKIPGLRYHEQDYIVASTLSIPDTTGLLKWKNNDKTSSQKPTCISLTGLEYYRRSNHGLGLDFGKCEPGIWGRYLQPYDDSSEKTIGGRWDVKKPILRQGTRIYAEGKVSAPIPLINKGKEMTERFLLVLNPTLNRDFSKTPPRGRRWDIGIPREMAHFDDRASEEGTFYVEYRFPLTGQNDGEGIASGFGQYYFGERGESVLRLVYENGEDLIRVTRVDAEHLTLETQLTWVKDMQVDPDGDLERGHNPQLVFLETFGYELNRVKEAAITK